MAFKQGKEKTFQDILAEMLGGVQGAGGFLDEAKGVMNSMTSKIAGVNKGAGVMDKAVAKPTKALEHLKGIDVMRGEDTYDYDFDVDGKTEGYTFTGDSPLSGEAIQNMRNIQGITADGGMLPKTSNLGFMGSSNPELMPGKTPTIPNVVPPGFHRMPDGTVMADGSMDYAGTGEVSPNPQTVDRTKFNSQFAELSEEEKARVKQLMSGMNDNEKAIFGAGLTGSPLSGYAVQNENYGSY